MADILYLKFTPERKQISNQKEASCAGCSTLANSGAEPRAVAGRPGVMSLGLASQISHLSSRSAGNLYLEPSELSEVR